MSSPPPPPPAQVYATGGTLPGAGQHQLVISNGVLLAAVVFLFMVVVFVFLLYLYAKRYLGANPLLGPAPSSTRFIFLDDAASPLPAARGLPPAVLHALPVTVHSTKKHGADEEAECAVCLSEVADGETVRALPKCGHAFHVACIDAWFRSRDTCPLCRAPVAEAAPLPRVPREGPVELPGAAVFPANVLFFGTHADVANAGLASPPPPPVAAASTSSGRRKENSLIIDIPTRPVSVASHATTSSSPTTPLPTSRMPGGTPDEMRSPLSARLRSLRRLLSRGKQAVSAGSPRGAGDVEQGFDPKTPKTPRSTTTNS